MITVFPRSYPLSSLLLEPFARCVYAPCSKTGDCIANNHLMKRLSSLMTGPFASIVSLTFI